MSKFIKRFDSTYADLSADLHEQDDWLVGELKHWEFAQDITTVAIDPVSSLVVATTAHGDIHIYGRPGVSISLRVPDRIGVKFAQISCSTFCLVCIDDHNRLHLWDLSNYGRPKYLTSAAFDQVNSLTLSPSHSHAFLSLQSGEVRTYDLTCRRKSPYTAPNMWRLYAEKMAASGLIDASMNATSIAVDAVMHPRNLNFLFVAYVGGVVLCDITECSTSRVFELSIPPGAPGGVGYGDTNIFLPRKPEVTSLAIHPAGHFFAVGYTDGVIAFWALEDEDQPLMVRTLDAVDVNIVDPDVLEQHLGEAKGKTPPTDREPVFKMSWSSFANSSDPRGGCTALTILGGLRTNDSPGVTVLWLPAFNPGEPPTPVSVPGSLHPLFRSAMRESLDPLDAYFYATAHLVQDYVLVPSGSPHFNNVFDPIAIQIISESKRGTRAVDAYEFPPPCFGKSESLKVEDGSKESTDTISSTLQELSLSDDPRSMRLPWTLSSNIMAGQLKVVERDIYQNLISDGGVVSQPVLPLKGGISWNEEVDVKGSKFQPNRILVQHTSDLTVCFYDISNQLLLAIHPDPIVCDFPNPLPHLTIDLNTVLLEPSVTSKVAPSSSLSVAIHSVHFSTESLEVVVVLTTGDLVVYRLNPGRPQSAPFRHSEDPTFVFLDHLSAPQGSRYSPYVLISPYRGQLTACANSDIGFLAISYSDGSLYIIDLRGPSILLHHNPNKAKARQSFVPLVHRTVDPVTSLTWTISPLSTDKNLGVRLVGIRSSGEGEVYTLHRESNSSWTCSSGSGKVDAMSEPFPDGTYVVDRKTGSHCVANRSRLSDLSDPGLSSSTYLVTAGIKGAKTFDTITGDRIGRTDWAPKTGDVRAVKLVEKLGSCALVAFTDQLQALVYSIPHLEFICNLPVPVMPTTSSFTIDKSGDFFGWSYHPRSGMIQSASYGTLFNMRRSLPSPDIDLTANKGSIPSQPQPVSMGPASFFGTWLPIGNQSISGAQVDDLLGGPNRPIPQAPQRPDASRVLSFEGVQQGAASLAASAQQTQSSLYARLSNALNDRGQALGNLEDQFNALEQGSRNMATQAKRLAAEQTAKQWFRFG